MCAAVAAGIYPSLGDAMKAMASPWEREYVPRPEESRIYARLYERYLALARFIEDETAAQGRGI
jgi:L-ribulokinase